MRIVVCVRRPFVSFTKAFLALGAVLLVFGFLQAAGLISFGGLFGGTVSAQEEKDPGADLTTLRPEVLNQLESLAEEKRSRTPAEQKIDSRLLFTIKMERGEAIASGVPTLETGLQADSEGFIEVDITADVTDRLKKRLAEAGAKIFGIYPQFRSVTASVPIRDIEALAEMSEVIFIQAKMEAFTNGFGSPQALPRTPGSMTLPNGLAPPVVPLRQDHTALAESLRKALLAGSAASEGDTTHRANQARALTGFDGTGIRIGVLSDGVNTLAARQATGDLPATVTVLPGQAGSGDEGTAMLEIVHDIAPGADLYFATAFGSLAGFAQNILDLRAAGCDIIIDDISYFVETPFQNGQGPLVVSPGNAGLIVQSVNTVTSSGAIYMSSAANSGNQNDSTSGAWEGDFANAGLAGGVLAGAGTLHNFGGGTTQNPMLTAGRVLLKWSDPLGASGNDYDIYALNAAGTGIVGAATNVQNGNDDPVEDLGNRSAGQRLVIVRWSGVDRFLHLNSNGGRITVSTSGTIYGHNGGLNTVSVAAAPAGPAVNNAAIGPFPFAHSPADVVETFSADGPRRIFYNADGTQITPGNVSSTGGQLLQKPDITAADGVTTTTPGFIPFFGTSASVPHAAGLMALLKQASPLSTNAQLYTAMTSSAIDIESPGFDRDSGAGIFMPLRAMNALGVTGPALLDNGQVGVADGNGNGIPEPGELVDLQFPLSNLGLSNATGITATLTTSTPGVTVWAGAPPSGLSYPNLAAAIGTGTSTLPFQIEISDTFPCGGTIDLTLTVSYSGGSLPQQVFSYTLEAGPPSEITTTLDATPPPTGFGYTPATGTQTGRLVRNGVASSCAVPKASPGLQDALPNRRYDSYVYTASASGCVTVTLSTSSLALFSAAYNNSGFVSANPTTNYLADAGVSAAATSYSFNVTAGQQFTVVVHEVTVGGGLGLGYTLNVKGPIAGLCLEATAADARISGRVFTNDGRPVSNAVVTMVDPDGIPRSVRTNPLGYFVVDDVPAGETYVLQVRAKGLAFLPRLVQVGEDIDSLRIFAEP
ncbi:MAG: carboxypeptidase regulatory-like domain-containing protein [Acidobacteriota bacterium]|nr:MAG: carboxypeptidase regulatory-like domain-containing protein [Acidobacteriota bacterium]